MHGYKLCNVILGFLYNNFCVIIFNFLNILKIFYLRNILNTQQ